jgi:uncharacterized protein (TIGR02996 family)
MSRRARSGDASSRNAGIGLLQAIIETPEDDAPRLIYADWLAEHGGPDDVARAEFIRLQIDKARLPEDDPRLPELNTREQFLLETHGESWRHDLPRWARKKCRFERGFVAYLHPTARQFIQDTAKLWQVTPLQRVWISNASRCVAALAACPWLLRLAELDLGFNRLVSDEAQALAASPNLANLTRLKLPYCHVGVEGAQTLAGSSHLGKLVELDVSANEIGSEGLRALAGAKWLANLTALNISDNNIDGEALRILFNSPHLGQLTSIGVTSNPLGAEGARVLAGAPQMAGFRELFLGMTELGDEGLRALADSPHLGNLPRLLAYGNSLRKAGKAALRQRFGSRTMV